MQLVADGPDIPESLLHDHEEGRVVFFCGAGISYPAGLPSYQDLVVRIYERIGETRDAREEAAYGSRRYDTTLDLLEHRVQGHAHTVRSELRGILKPNLRRKGATDTHLALLRLARNRDGTCRIVTTNFDQLFEKVRRREKLSVPSFSAPCLPIPKRTRWDGLVYLHGLMPPDPTPSDLGRLVLTSGDFGLAYLTERWAARFVSDLFRSYVVCFVGYSVEDPVLRYMMDALAADRMRGESAPQAFALAGCDPSNRTTVASEWKAKGIVPVLYDVPPKDPKDHSMLHSTLWKWGELHRDGINAKEQIVVTHAIAHPSASTEQDDFVGRMLWALSDPSALPAKQFAEFEPAPTLEWLWHFSKNRYRHDDLRRFGVYPTPETDEGLEFSLANRPAPYSIAPWMSLTPRRNDAGRLDPVMWQLCRWLVRHLDEVDLLVWVAEQGGCIHESLAREIESALHDIARLEREGKTDELAELRNRSPRAIPRPGMRVLWRLILGGRTQGRKNTLDLFSWERRYKTDGLTTTLRLQLRSLVAPRVRLRNFSWPRRSIGPTPERPNDLVDCEVVPAAEDVFSALLEVLKAPDFAALLDEFQLALVDALDLMGEYGGVHDSADRSYWDLPSIAPHGQNRRFHPWVDLIELVREAWLRIQEGDSERAARIASAWFAMPYLCFKRLALFAASHCNDIGPDEWIGWLLLENSRWLWSIRTRRETLRLFVTRGRDLGDGPRERLEGALILGPDRSWFPDFHPADWDSFAEHATWLRLAKLRSSGSELGRIAGLHLTEFSLKHPRWRLAHDDRDEFPHWMTITGDGSDDAQVVVIAPTSKPELMEWLRAEYPSEDPIYEDNWREKCRGEFGLCADALAELAAGGEWPTERWRQALQAWSEADNAKASWERMASILDVMPIETLAELEGTFSWWLESVSKVASGQEPRFLSLCGRVLDLETDSQVFPGDPLMAAVNHPVGKVTQALLNEWGKADLHDNDGLTTDLEPLLTRICDAPALRFRHGRVLLASRAIALFRVDPNWAREHLLKRFDWSVDVDEALAAWAGFLWSPRLHAPLLREIKGPFLQTAGRCRDLGDLAQQFCSFLTYAALEGIEGYDPEDFGLAFRELPKKELDHCAHALVQAQNGAGNNREEYWLYRVKPFWHRVWPKESANASSQLAEKLARLSIAAGDEFPSALKYLRAWFQRLENAFGIVHALQKAGSPGRFPTEALELLDLVVKDDGWHQELRECLNAIAQARPVLKADTRYQRLDNMLRKQGR